MYRQDQAPHGQARLCSETDGLTDSLIPKIWDEEDVDEDTRSTY